MALIGFVSTISTMLAVLLTIDAVEGNNHAHSTPAYLLLLFGYASALMVPGMLIVRRRFHQSSALSQWMVALGLPLGYASIISLLLCIIG